MLSLHGWPSISAGWSIFRTLIFSPPAQETLQPPHSSQALTLQFLAGTSPQPLGMSLPIPGLHCSIIR
jgi:hypothetical protein